LPFEPRGLPRPPEPRLARPFSASFCLYRSSHCSSVRYSLPPDWLGGGGSGSSSDARSRPVISSTDSVSTSSSVSIETTNCLYLVRAMRRYLRTTLCGGSGSPSVASWLTRLVSRRAKSSTPSPSRSASSSYSRRTRCALVFLMRSSPIRMVRSASYASFADGLTASVGIISGGTALQIASSAIRSSCSLTSSPGSMALQRLRDCNLIFISNAQSL
jgi:hypothetical protein